MCSSHAEADAVADLTDGGADHVIEAIGLTETVEQAIELVATGRDRDPGGHDAAGRRASFDVYRFVEDGKQIRGSNYGSATPAIDFPRIAALYAEGRLPLDLLVTERIGLESVEAPWTPCDEEMARDEWSCTDRPTRAGKRFLSAA